MIDSHRWDLIQTLFEAALPLRPYEQQDLLDARCGDDEELRKEVESLLAAHDAGLEELEEAPVRLIDESSLRPAATLKIAGYEILEELGRGGQGVVYRAHQQSTKRDVALKVLLVSQFADEAAKRRFEREIELVGSLKHPGIVPVYDSGTAEGWYFYAMEYVAGESLDEFVKRGQRSPRETLRLVQQVCDAMGYAHQKGVIHRDLKPSNVLIDETGRPRVVDFGLATTGPDGDHQLSLGGQVLGTLTYMSPEQASGRSDEIDLRSDVYSLGVVLYELLSGSPPFALDSSIADNLHTIQCKEPKRLSIVDPRIGHEVAAIASKAMAKEKQRRYPTAGALAEDIGRYLRGEPIEAKEDSGWYLMTKTLRRHLFATLGVAAFLLVLTATTVVAWSLYLRATEARDRERVAATKLREERDRAESLRVDSQGQLYRAEMNLAGQALADSAGIGRLEEIVDRWKHQQDAAGTRGWEWNYLRAHCDQELSRFDFAQKLWTFALSPDETQIVVAGVHDTILMTPIDLSLNANRLLAAPIVIPGHDSSVRAVAFNADGTRLATGSPDGHVIIWDPVAQEVVEQIDHADHVLAVDWHPTQPQVLATSSIDGDVRVQDLESGQVMHRFQTAKGAQALTWSHDGTRLALGTWRRTIHIWDLEGDVQETVRQASSPVFGLSWAPDDGRIAVSQTRGQVWTFDPNAEGEEPLWLQTVETPVWAIAYHPDGSIIATGGEDRSIHLWSAEDGRQLQTLRGHTAPIWQIAWCQNGRRLVTSAHDGTVRVWEPDSTVIDQTFRIAETQGRQLECAKYSPDGSELVVVPLGPEAYLIDSCTGALRLALSHGSVLVAAAWSPDGTRVATGGRDTTVIVWDAVTGQELCRFSDHAAYNRDDVDNPVLCIRWSPDGEQIASTTHFGPLFVWDAKTGEAQEMFDHQETLRYDVDWSLDGRTLAVAGSWGATLIDIEHGTLQRYDTINGYGKSCEWSPDGSMLAAAENLEGRIAIFDRAGNLIHLLTDHVGPVTCVRWHPHGGRLASSSADGTVRVWDTTAGAQTLALRNHTGFVAWVDWSPDGQRLVSVGRDGDVHIWNAACADESAQD